MAQMRITLTSPYGVVTRDFPDDERDIATTRDGEVAITQTVLDRLLDQAVHATHDQQLDPMFEYDSGDEGDYAIARTGTMLGKRYLDVDLLRSQDDILDLPDGVDMSELRCYFLESLPFEVTVEDTTGQLYDEVMAGEA